MAPIILATDKTQLTQFSGSKSAYPVYLTVGNLPRAIRRKPSQRACILIAYLSVSKSVGAELSQKQKSARIQQLFHDSMRIVLEPLRDAGRNGIEVTGGDGCVRMVHPIIACYVADYPEQCLITCSKYTTCPKCKLDSHDIGQRNPGESRNQRETIGIIEQERRTATSISNFQERCREHNISGGVTRPFWEGFPFCDIHFAVAPDILHQLYQGVVKHLIHWCTSFMTEKELDARIKALPPCFGVRHFKKGWSELSQVSGKERKDMARILLGCIIGKVPAGVITCYRAILDFVYIAQYPSHDDITLNYLEEALDLFHANKDILLQNGLNIREHLNIPKFHSMVHYTQYIRAYGTTDNYNTEMFERFHIDCAKEAWRASNFRNEVPQMTQWLIRQEKVAMFDIYLSSHLKSEEEAQDDETEAIDTRDKNLGLVISRRPHSSNQPLASIQIKHMCPSFSHHLRIFLNSFMSRGEAIPRQQLSSAVLPFQTLNVWHSFKFGLDSLGNDVDGGGGMDGLKAQPGDQNHTARFDTVLVAHTDIAQSTGLEGRSIKSSLRKTSSYLCVQE